MTTSVWNNSEIKKQFAECNTLRDIITQLESDFSGRGEVICEIRINGVLLNEDDEVKYADSPCEEIQDLRISSNRPDDLIMDALNSVSSYIPQLEEQTVATAELFRGSDLLQAQRSFTEALDGCKWFFDTLVHVRNAASGIGRPLYQAERWFGAEKVIMRVIREVSQAYSAGDFVLIADLLEYELTSGLGIWREVLQEELKHRHRVPELAVE